MMAQQKQHNAFSLKSAFNKYDMDNKGCLNKIEFKCAFIFLTGMKPTKDDMNVISQLVPQQQNFQMNYQTFAQVMTLYLQQIEQQSNNSKILQNNEQAKVDEQWEMIGGKAKGFLTIKDYYEQFNQFMPSLCDRDLALELFQELDTDKDGKLTFKDFHDAMLFEL